MKPIYQDAKDQNKAGTFIYTKGEDGKAYVDEECTVQFKASELKDAYMKRAIISSSGEFIIPTILSTEGNGITSVGCIVDGGTLVKFASVAD